ncbi:MAG: glycosyltransferase, partial [Flavobacterium sp.]
MVQKETVRISVILPVYNGGEYLKKSIQSVLSQSFSHFEFLVIDDCSTDGSFEWIKEVDDDRIQLHRNQYNRGLFYNLNFLIKLSSGNLIKLWSQDDIMYANCLAQVVDFHEKYPNIGFSYSGRDMIDEEGRIKVNLMADNTPEIIPTMLHAHIAYHTGSIAGNISNTCITRCALDTVGFFHEGMKISADFDMWVRLAQYFDTGFIQEKLIQLRDHKSQLSRNEKYYINHVKEDLEVYRYLDNYIGEDMKIEGRKILRTSKLVFYYTLMIKSLLRGEWRTTRQYYSALSAYDNFFLISLN